MIDVQPWVDKLEELKRFMCHVIDGGGSYILVGNNFYSSLRPEDLLDLFFQTGILVYRTDLSNESKRLGFSEWYNYIKDETTKSNV